MPTQIAQSRKPLLHGLLFLLAAWGGCAPRGEERPDSEKEAAPALIVKTVPAQNRTIEDTLEVFGQSEALPDHRVTLTAALEGHVAQICVDLGKTVGQGDLIVELDATIARAEVAEREAQRDILKAALDLLAAEPRPEDRKGLEIAIEQAKASVERTKAAVERLLPLRARNEVSEAQIFESRQALLQAQLLEQSAEAQLRLLMVGPRAEAVAEAKARLAAAEESLALFQARLKLYSICSPISGVLDSLNCHPGQTIAAGSAIGEVVDTSEMFVTLWVTPTAASRIEVGQAVRVRSHEQSPSSFEPTLEHDSTMAGVIFSIGRIVDPATGNLPVRIYIKNPAPQLAVGQTVAATIVIEQRHNCLAVPSTALVDLGDGPLVAVIREGKVVQLHPSSTVTRGKWTVLSGSDLKAGELIVVEGGFNVPEGTAVQTLSAQGEN